METFRTACSFSEALGAARRAGRRVGVVPTMGALHAGHRALMARARAECDLVAVTVFVNPLQFGEPEDLDRYPRTLSADLALCQEGGVDAVFVPAVEEMYPGWPAAPATTVSVRHLTDLWEGAARPGHFDGVATVVAKLLSMAGECRAYFGEKDFQQLAVVRRMVADLSLPATVVGCPTVRDADGLALSSRNARLSPAERRAATVLWRALAAGRRSTAGGERRPAPVAAVMAEVVRSEPAARLEYAAAVDAADLTVPVDLWVPERIQLLVAGRVGPVRLIDNCAAPRPLGVGAPLSSATPDLGEPADRTPAAAATGVTVPAGREGGTRSLAGLGDLPATHLRGGPCAGG